MLALEHDEISPQGIEAFAPCVGDLQETFDEKLCCQGMVSQLGDRQIMLLTRD